MLKQITFTVDTSDPLQAQWLVEYLASPDRVRFGRTCLLLGFLAATGQAPIGGTHHSRASGPETADATVAGDNKPQRRTVGKSLFGIE